VFVPFLNLKPQEVSSMKRYKNLMFPAFALCLVIVLSGCSAYSIAPVTGFAYTEVYGPVSATSNDLPSSPKMGTATCTSILGLIARGDASINAAMKDGGITKIHHVDFASKNILGLYAEFTVIVYGE
jgi:hypothetical protein